MRTSFEGEIIVLGDNIDTDQIVPGRYVELVDPAEIAKHCLEGVDPAIAGRFPKGGIVVAGTNFGCGSSREHAAIALISMGAAAVIADSFARIFFRNAINLGLPLIVCPGISGRAREGQTLAVDLVAGTVTAKESGESFACEKMGEQAFSILEAGGIKALMRQRLGL